MSDAKNIRFKWFERVLSVAVLVCFACLARAGEHLQYRQGTLAEVNTDFPCNHECGPFETDYFNFCIQSGDQIFLARLFDTRFNYDPKKLLPLVGKPIQFRSDAENVWIVRPDGKEFHLKQNYSDGYFVDARCVAALHRHILQENPPKARLDGVDADAVYVPLNSKVGYWTKCLLAPDQAIVCFARGPKGEEFSHVYQSLPGARTNSDLEVDPLRTNYDTIVLVSGKTLVRKND